MPKKIFVLVPYLGRSDEEIQSIRENAVSLWNLYQVDDAQLVTPIGKRLTGDMEAIMQCDIVIKTKYYTTDPVCVICEQVASIYDKMIYDDRYIPDLRNDPVVGDNSELM